MARIMVHYFVTKNRISPFVAMIGDWPNRAAMVRTVRVATKLCCRPAIPEEVDLYSKSTRCVAVTWQHVKDLLWDHQEGPLKEYYPALVASLRSHSRAIKNNLGIVKKKEIRKQREREKFAEIARKNRLKSKTRIG